MGHTRDVREGLVRRINDIFPSKRLEDWPLTANQLASYFTISDYHFKSVKELSGDFGLSVAQLNKWINVYAEAGLLEADSKLVSKTKRAMTYRRRYFKVEVGIYGVEWRSKTGW